MTAIMPNVQIFTPASREEWLALRAPTCGSSEAPALLGLHPQMTAFELFARHTGRYHRPFAEIEVREKSIHLPPHERGNFLEEKGFELTRMLRPEWTVIPNTIPGGCFYQDLKLGISATPDAFVTAPDRPRRGALQIKNVAQHIFNKDWKNADTGDFQLPDYVAVQAIVDAWISGCEWALAGAMVANFWVDFYLEEVPLHSGILSRVLAEAAEFQRRLRENDPYPPDYARDGEVIKKLYAEDDGATIDLSGNKRVAKLAARHLALKKIESAAYAAEKERSIIDPEIIEALGNAKAATVDGFLIKAKTVRRSYKAKEAYTTSSRPVKITIPGLRDWD